MLRWKIKNLMDRVGITPYQMSQILQGKVARNTVYALYRGETQKTDLPVLDILISTLREKTGEDIQVSDVLEYVDHLDPYA